MTTAKRRNKEKDCWNSPPWHLYFANAPKRAPKKFTIEWPAASTSSSTSATFLHLEATLFHALVNYAALRPERIKQFTGGQFPEHRSPALRADHYFNTLSHPAKPPRNKQTGKNTQNKENHIEHWNRPLLKLMNAHFTIISFPGVTSAAMIFIVFFQLQNRDQNRSSKILLSFTLTDMRP